MSLLMEMLNNRQFLNSDFDAEKGLKQATFSQSAANVCIKTLMLHMRMSKNDSLFPPSFHSPCLKLQRVNTRTNTQEKECVLWRHATTRFSVSK